MLLPNFSKTGTVSKPLKRFNARVRTPVSRALQSPWPFCQYKFKLNNCYHVKEHEKLCKNSKKDPFKAQKSSEELSYHISLILRF